MLVNAGDVGTYLSKLLMQRGDSMSNIDQVTNMVDRQINLISKMDDSLHIDYIIALSGGFLTGMVLSGVIDMQERKLYMRKIVDFADQVKKEKECVTYG